MARIILEHDGHVLKDYPLHRGGITIGRRKENTVVLGSPEVSGIHARIDRNSSEYIITDLQSTNGTLVNGRRVFSHRLIHGDRIAIGKDSLLFIGTEKAKIEAQEAKIPLDRTVIIGGVSKRRRTTGTQVATVEENVVLKPRRSSHPARLLVVAFALCAVLLTLGVSTMKDEPSYPKRIMRTGGQNSGSGREDAPTFARRSVNPIAVTASTADKSGSRPSLHKDFSAESASPAVDNRLPTHDNRGFDIEAIVWSSDARKSLVIINGVRLRTGESFEGSTVTEIGRDYIVLQAPSGESISRLTLR